MTKLLALAFEGPFLLARDPSCLQGPFLAARELIVYEFVEGD
jgi:hypothetical protein